MSIEEEILNSSPVVAVVRLSPRPDRPSYGVANYLKEKGYRIIPVNPGTREVRKEFGTRILVAYLVIISAMALALGWCFSII